MKALRVLLLLVPSPRGHPTRSLRMLVALQSLRDALAQQGLQYTVIMTVSEYDIEGPTLSGFDIRLTDRDVILARTDLMTDLSNVQAHSFTTNLTFTLLGQQVTILRGW